MTASFLLFCIEILTTTVVVDDFKYSFFFYLDIIATLSLINDIPWFLNALTGVILQTPDYLSVNAIPGTMHTEDATTGKL